MQITPDLTETSVEILRSEPLKEMLTIRKEGDKTLVRINSSSLGIIQECLRKAQFTLKDGWHSATEAPATLFGSAVHKSLEVFYSGNLKERKLPKLETMELMSYGHKIEGEDQDLLLRATRAFVNKAELLKGLPETDKRSIQNGVYLLHHYFSAFLDDPYLAYIDENGPFIERKFSFRLHETKDIIIEYFGTIDLIMKHALTGEILVADHKTSSVVGNDFYNRLKPNHQYTGYLMGAKYAYGIETNSFLVNCLQVKAKPVTARGTPPHFPRQITTRDMNDYLEFKESVIHAVDNYLNAIGFDNFPMGHVNACAMYAGCQYLQVCGAPKNLRENVLNAKFVRSRNAFK